MLTSDFDFNLPDDLIAQSPSEPRDHSRLMVLHRKTKQVEHREVFVPGAVDLHGPVEQRYSEGAVIVSDGKYNWGLAPDVAARNWVIKGSQGEEQPLTDLTKQLPEVKF